jgi:hypothetical protein
MREEKKKDAAEAKAKQARPTGTAIALVEDANVDFNTAIAIALVDLRSPATHNRWG